jgi:hypothetical protein
MGEYNADYGTVLINRGNGSFSTTLLNGMAVKGEVRHVRKINAGKKEAFVLAKNNDSLKVLGFR